MRISDWSSDVCSSDLEVGHARVHHLTRRRQAAEDAEASSSHHLRHAARGVSGEVGPSRQLSDGGAELRAAAFGVRQEDRRSEEHTSELQSLMRISYAVFCLKKKKKSRYGTNNKTH